MKKKQNPIELNSTKQQYWLSISGWDGIWPFLSAAVWILPALVVRSKCRDPNTSHFLLSTTTERSSLETRDNIGTWRFIESWMIYSDTERNDSWAALRFSFFISPYSTAWRVVVRRYTQLSGKSTSYTRQIPEMESHIVLQIQRYMKRRTVEAKKENCWKFSIAVDDERGNNQTRRYEKTENFHS